MLALSIRQPFAELILRGIKTVEYRSRATKMMGDRFYLYATKKALDAGRWELGKTAIWSDDLAVARPPAWMIELAAQVGVIPPDADLPLGMIVGSASIERVDQTADGMFRWHLAGVERLKAPRKPQRHPQPVWFRPFD